MSLSHDTGPYFARPRPPGLQIVPVQGAGRRLTYCCGVRAGASDLSLIDRSLETPRPPASLCTLTSIDFVEYS
ncbi:hypothetical protein V1282_002904 [Nitrobacteraceae bacterium AZCC 2146]